MEGFYLSNIIDRLIVSYGTMVVIVIPLICWAIQAVGKFLIFKKAGKTPWHAFIPVWSDWEQLDLAWDRTIAWLWVGILVLCALFLSGAVNAVFHIKPYIHDSLTIMLVLTLAVIMVINCYQLAKAFGKKFAFALGLFFVYPVFMLILGLDDSKYLGPQS